MSYKTPHASWSLTLPDPDATRALGSALAKVLKAGNVLALSGDLGAGKTTLVQGLATALGVDGDVLSPTFALMDEHKGAIPLLHMDAYRLNGAEDAEQLGLDDYIEAGWLLVVEWPEAIEGALPEDILTVTLEYLGDQRRATVTAGGPQSARQLEALRDDA